MLGHLPFGIIMFLQALRIETGIQGNRQLARYSASPPPNSPLAELSHQPQVLCPADFKHNLRITPKKATINQLELTF